jgi:hypothetical protein
MMFSVAGLVPPMVELLGLLNVRLTVSSPSTSTSSKTDTVKVWLVLPGGKVSVPVAVV